MLRLLAAACGANGMAGGQALDLAAVGQQLRLVELERMHVHKTGALIRASVALGCLSSGKAGDTVLAALERYGHSVGLAFQIRDDILDIEGETEVIGKQRGADAARDKPTYPAILGMAAAKSMAEDQRAAALAALERARSLQADMCTADLEDLAHYAVDRRS
jgi:geranylgeranyl pyrophosphate synthase